MKNVARGKKRRKGRCFPISLTLSNHFLPNSTTAVISVGNYPREETDLIEIMLERSCFSFRKEEESNSINRILSFQFRHRSSEGRLVEERKNGEKSDVVTRGTRFRNGRGNDLRRRRRRRKMRVESVHSCTDSGSRTWLHPRDAVNSGQTCRGLEETGPRMSLTAHLTVAHLRSISSHLTLHPFHIYASMWPAKVSLSSSIARQQSLLWILSEGRGEGRGC